jgi:hypothetical protein
VAKQQRQSQRVWVPEYDNPKGVWIRCQEEDDMMSIVPYERWVNVGVDNVRATFLNINVIGNAYHVRVSEDEKDSTIQLIKKRWSTKREELYRMHCKWNGHICEEVPMPRTIGGMMAILQEEMKKEGENPSCPPETH